MGHVADERVRVPVVQRRRPVLPDERVESPGYVSFQRNGKKYTMEPVVDGKYLWFVMRDATSGKTTYAQRLAQQIAGEGLDALGYEFYSLVQSGRHGIALVVI